MRSNYNNLYLLGFIETPLTSNVKEVSPYLEMCFYFLIASDIRDRHYQPHI